MLVGYARVSTPDQYLALQCDAYSRLVATASLRMSSAVSCQSHKSSPRCCGKILMRKKTCKKLN